MARGCTWWRCSDFGRYAAISVATTVFVATVFADAGFESPYGAHERAALWTRSDGASFLVVLPFVFFRTVTVFEVFFAERADEIHGVGFILFPRRVRRGR